MVFPAHVRTDIESNKTQFHQRVDQRNDGKSRGIENSLPSLFAGILNTIQEKILRSAKRHLAEKFRAASKVVEILF